jgi:hypothetical protein
MTKSAYSRVRRSLRRNLRRVLSGHLRVHCLSGWCSTALSALGPRSVRPILLGLPDARRECLVHNAESRWSGEGGSDPLSKRLAPLAQTGVLRVLGGRSLPRPVRVLVVNVSYVPSSGSAR